MYFSRQFQIWAATLGSAECEARLRVLPDRMAMSPWRPSSSISKLEKYRNNLYNLKSIGVIAGALIGICKWPRSIPIDADVLITDSFNLEDRGG
jgi:hypothetical protein